MTAPGRPTIDVNARGAEADCATVDLLARLQLAARRGGRRLRVRNASVELRELVVFLGLHDALPIDDICVVAPSMNTDASRPRR